MLDSALVNGLVVVPDEARQLDIGIAHGKIAVLAEPGCLPDAREVIDVSGRTVVPGAIDPHVHCDNVRSDPRGGPDTVSEGPDRVGMAALLGGTTTMIDFVWLGAAETIQAGIERTLARWRGQCPCDFSFHIVLRGEVPPQTLQEIPDAVSSGFPSFKLFTTNVLPHNLDGIPAKIDITSMRDILAILLANGGVAALHAEDDDLVQSMYRRYFASGKTHYTYLPEVHSSLSEDLAFRKAVRLAEGVGGAPIYFMHVSAAHGVDCIADARARGLPVFGETLHQYALHTSADYHEHDGMKYHTYPSLKTADDVASLWAGVESGSISAFATDEIATSYAVKTRGRLIDDVVGGNTGIEPKLAILFTEMVDKRRMPLTRFVQATATNAAKIFGLYPAKGAILLGSDADLVAMESGIERTVSAADLHESDYTPWEGWRVTAWPTLTLLRGQVAARDGQFVSATKGRLVPRRLSSDLLSGSRYV